MVMIPDDYEARVWSYYNEAISLSRIRTSSANQIA